MNLFVSNLGYKVTDESLDAVFATHGKVKSIRLLRDHSTGYSKGEAYVDMPNDAEAEKAMAKIHGTVLDGRDVSVKEVKPTLSMLDEFISRVKGM